MPRPNQQSFVQFPEPVAVGSLRSRPKAEPGFRKLWGYELSPCLIVSGRAECFHSMETAEESRKEKGVGTLYWALYWRVLQPNGTDHLARHIKDFVSTPGGRQEAVDWLRKELGSYFIEP